MHYTNLMTLRKVEGEMAFVMMIYNIKRSLNIVGIDGLMEFLKGWQPDYRKVHLFVQKRTINLRLEVLFEMDLSLAA
jgi:hypothetical protein